MKQDFALIRFVQVLNKFNQIFWLNAFLKWMLFGMFGETGQYVPSHVDMEIQHDKDYAFQESMVGKIALVELWKLKNVL